MMLRSIFQFGLLIIIVLNLLLTCSSLSAEEARNIYLVRHAEKRLDGTRDPSLTKAGRLRANNISQQLSNSNIIAVYSTNYKRTKQTALPLAKLLEISLSLYDPRQLGKFAKKILSGNGNVLIVGHSNTTPELIKLLGGDSYGPIADTVYDRLYQLSIKESKIETILLSSKAD